jgi:hypothetical protein
MSGHSRHKARVKNIERMGINIAKEILTAGGRPESAVDVLFIQQAKVKEEEEKHAKRQGSRAKSNVPR